MFKYISDSSSLLSNISLDSIDDEDGEPWKGLIQKLTTFHLDALLAKFKEGTYKIGIYKSKTKMGLGREEFVKAIDEIFGNCKHSVQATILYAQIDHENHGIITWDQFLDFVIENSSFDTKPPFTLNVSNIFSPPHVKKDTIAKIVLIETDKHFCYAIFSKYGHVGLYDGNMNFLTSYQMVMVREDIGRKEKERRRRNRWVTDAVFLKDVLMLAIATSTRSIACYDVSGLTHVALWLILGVPNVIQCFAHNFNTVKGNLMLYMGDDSGQLIVMDFLQPKNGILRKKHNDKLSLFYWSQLTAEKEYVIIKYLGRLHCESVTALQHCNHNNSIVSSSRDAQVSVVIKALENRRQNYTFQMHRGVSCFAVSTFLQILITGSCDGTIRLWNTVVKDKPIAVLKEHHKGIVDIKIIASEELFLSCSTDGVFKMWKIKEAKCVQTVKLKFPSFQVLGKTIEWSFNAIYPGPKTLDVCEYTNDGRSESDSIWLRPHLFVTCCNYIAQLNLCFTDTEKNVDFTVCSPPPLQNSVLIPTTWKIDVDAASSSDEKSKDSVEEIDNETLVRHVESLKFILEKNLVLDNSLENDINFRLACLEKTKLKIKMMVSNCAPYLALDLPEIEEIKLSPNLPMPSSKRVKHLAEKTQRMLSDVGAKPRASLERSSSSRTQSSRSSIITFE